LFFQKYFQRPIHLFGTLGLLSLLGGTLISIYLTILKILGEDIWGRPILMVAFILLLGGVQLITSGIVAEMIVRTYFESQNKKTYTLREVFRGEEKSDQNPAEAVVDGTCPLPRFPKSRFENYFCHCGRLQWILFVVGTCMFRAVKGFLGHQVK